MKDEQDLKWIILLYNSPYTRNLLNFKLGRVGCKKDFERAVGASENNKLFQFWFKRLLAFGVLEKRGIIRKGNRNNVVVNGYVINTSQLVKYAKSNSFYSPAYKFFNMDRVI